MKRSFFTCAFMLLAIVLFAQTSLDEMAIKKVIKQQETAWNKHDWQAFSSYFTEDATLINFVGQVWKSRRDILAHFELLSNCCLMHTSLKFQVKHVKFLTPDIAIVYTEEILFADKDYNVPFHRYKKGEKEYKLKTDIFERKNGSWKIKATQVTLINQMLSPSASDDL